jgi:hypothetical protein
MIVGNRERESTPTTFTISKAVEPVGGADAAVIKQLQTQIDALTEKASTTTGPTVRDVENLKSQIDALSFQMGDVVGRLGTRITSVETVNTTQNTKITALEATGVASTAAVFGVADTAWTACTMAAGITDKLWARVYKGRVIFKAAASATGTASSLFTGRLTSQSSFKQIATLPGGLPKPNGNQDWYCPVTTYQQGQSVPYSTTLIYMSGSSGNMFVVAGNVPMDGIFPESAAGYPVGAI